MNAILYRDRFTDQLCIVVGPPYSFHGFYYFKIREVEYNPQKRTARSVGSVDLPAAADDLERVGDVKLIP